MSKDQESIQVTIRVRPSSDKQAIDDFRHCVKVDKDTHTLALTNNNDSKTFGFDSICDVDENQQDIFVKVGMNSTKRCLQGYNCSIFAYGQTGAGKTFTMMGVNFEDPSYHEKRGLIPRTLEHIFQSIQKDSVENRSEYLIKCTFLEIYNEQIIDLMNKSSVNMQIREDLKKGVYVEGIQQEIISRSDEAMDILRKGSKGRHVGSTYYNQTSSRSHSVFTMHLQSKTVKNGLTNMKSRRFHFIDLAGSERTKLANGDRLKQGCSINKSLTVLGMVINSLAEQTEGKSRHINYRDSKLTFLLKDALGGNSKTHLIANISPVITSYQQTMSTLQFARRVKQIKLNKVSINEDASGNLEALKGEIRRLKQEIIKFKSSPMVAELKSDTEQTVSSGTKEDELERMLIKNENKMNLEKILQEYIQESIEKDAKFEVELLKKQEKLGYLTQGIKEYSKNELNLRMIIKLYEEKFKRMKYIDEKLKKSVEIMTVSQKLEIAEYLKNQREALQKEIQQYKCLMHQSPFIKNLMKSNNVLEDEKPEENLNNQLQNNLNFLKELRSRLEENISQRNELNKLIENYSMNKEEELSPRKRKILEREFESKERQYAAKLDELELENSYLKSTIEETETLLKESVDKELTLEDKLKEQNASIDELLVHIKDFEQKELHRYNELLKQKEYLQIQSNEKCNKLSMELFSCHELLGSANDQLNQMANRNKALERVVEDGKQKIDGLTKKIVDQEEYMKVVFQQHSLEVSRYKQQAKQIAQIVDAKAVQLGEKMTAIEMLNDRLNQENAKILKLEEVSRYLKQEIKASEYKFKEYRQMEQVNIQNLKKALSDSDNDNLVKASRITELSSSLEQVNAQIDQERLNHKKREEEFKELLNKKQMSDNELQNKVDNLKFELIEYSEKMQENHIANQNVIKSLQEQISSHKLRVTELERLLELAGEQKRQSIHDIEQLKEQVSSLNRQIEEQQVQNQNVNDRMREEIEKSKRLLNKLQKLRTKERYLQQVLEKRSNQLSRSQQAATSLEEKCKANDRSLKSLSEQLNNKLDQISLLRLAHQKVEHQLTLELETNRQKSVTHQAYLKQVFEDCLATKEKVINELKNINHTQSTQIIDLTEKYSETRDRAKQLEAQLLEAVDSVDKKQHNLLKISESFELLKEEIEHMKTNFEQRMEERENNYTEFIDNKNQQIEASKNQLHSMQNQNIKLRQQIAALLEKLQADTALIIASDIKQKESLQNVDRLHKINGTIQLKVQQLELEAATMRQSLDSQLQMNITNNLKIQQYQKKVEQLGEHLNKSQLDAQQRLQNTQEQLTTLQREWKNKSKQSEQYIKEIKQQYELKIDNATQELNMLRTECATQNNLQMQRIELSKVNQQRELHLLKHKHQSEMQECRLKIEKLELADNQHKYDANQMIKANANLTQQLTKTINQYEKKLLDIVTKTQVEQHRYKQQYSTKIMEISRQLEQIQSKYNEQLQLQVLNHQNQNEKQVVVANRINNLKQQNQELKQKLTDLYSEISDLRSVHNQMQVKEINQTKTIEETHRENNQLNAKIEQLGKEQRQKSERFTIILREKEILLKQAEDHVVEFRNKINDLQERQNTVTRQSKQELDKIRTQFNQQLAVNASQYDTQISEFKKKMENSQIKLKNLEKEITELKCQLKQQSSLKNQSDGKIQSLQTRIQQLITQSLNIPKIKAQAQVLININAELEEELKKERENIIGYKKLLANSEMQKQNLELSVQEKQEAYRRLLAKIPKIQQMKKSTMQAEAARKNGSVVRTAELLEKSRAEIVQLKKVIEENNKMIKKLKTQLANKEETYGNIHNKAEEFCRNQQNKVNQIKADYLRLQNQHRLLIKEKQKLEDVKNQNQMLMLEGRNQNIYQDKLEKKISDLEEQIQNANRQIHSLNEEIDQQRKEPNRIIMDTNDKKMHYINKIKQQNNLLKKQKSVLTQKLQSEIQQKKLLKGQINNLQKKGAKDSQNRNSLVLLDSLSNNIEVTLKIELERKLAEIKYLQEGFAQLCILLGIKRLPENKTKGESTKSLIMSAVEEMIKQLAHTKNRLRQKQQELDTKTAKFDILNKEYANLKNRITEAKLIKDNVSTLHSKQQNNHIHRRMSSRITNLLNIDQNQQELGLQQARRQLRQASRRGKQRIN